MLVFESFDDNDYVFTCTRKVLTLSVSQSKLRDSAKCGSVIFGNPVCVREHKLFFPHAVVSVSATPQSEWTHSDHVVLAFVVLSGGDIFKVSATSLAALNPSGTVVEESSVVLATAPLPFSSLSDLLQSPLPTLHPAAPLTTSLHRQLPGLSIGAMFSLGHGALLVSGRDGSVLLLSTAGSSQEVVWPLAIGSPASSVGRGVRAAAASPVITAAMLLTAHCSSHVQFRSALLAHVVGVDAGTPLVLLGTREGSLLWMPLQSTASSRGKSSSTREHTRVYFLRRFSQSPVTGISISEGWSGGVAGAEDSRLCLAHEDSSIAFMRVCRTPTSACQLADDGSVPLRLPVRCKDSSAAVWRGVVLALSAGGALVASSLQLTHPAAPPALLLPLCALSGEGMKPIRSFALSCDSPSRRICLCFADGTLLCLPLPPPPADPQRRLALSAGLAFTRNQAHLRASQEILQAIHSSLAQLSAFSPLHRSKCASASPPSSWADMRCSLASITAASAAKTRVSAQLALLDAELLRSAALAQLLQTSQWQAEMDVQLDLAGAHGIVCTTRPREFCGVIVISTASSLAVRALQGRSLRATWQCCAEFLGAGVRRQSLVCEMHFQPSSSAGGVPQTHTSRVLLPLQIHSTAPHELQLEVVVGTRHLQLLLSPLTAPLRHQVRVGKAGLLSSDFSSDGGAGEVQPLAGDSGGEGSELLNIPLATIHSSLAEILHATGGFVEAASEPGLVAGLGVGASRSTSTKERAPHGGARVWLGQALSRRASRPDKQHVLTSYVPVLPGEAGVSSTLLCEVEAAARAVEAGSRACAGREGAGSYSLKTTSAQVKQPRVDLPASSGSASVDSVRVLLHKSNSRILLALLQSELHSRVAEALAGYGSSSARADGGRSDEEEEEGVRFEDKDLYALPRELQQAMVECQSIVMKLSAETERFSRELESSVRHVEEEVSTARVGRSLGWSDGAASAIELSTGGRREVLLRRCEDLWALYQLVREYGV